MSVGIILFDGVCNLCNASVQFIIKRDTKGLFKFASLQSEIAQSYLGSTKLNSGVLTSIVLVKDGKIYQQSDAILQIVKLLRSPWPFLYYFGLVIPRFIREALYRLIARNRYRLFGKRDECMLPTRDIQQRFL